MFRVSEIDLYQSSNNNKVLPHLICIFINKPCLMYQEDIDYKSNIELALNQNKELRGALVNFETSPSYSFENLLISKWTKLLCGPKITYN